MKSIMKSAIALGACGTLLVAGIAGARANDLVPPTENISGGERGTISLVQPPPPIALVNEVIDFEGIAPGTILNQVFSNTGAGPIGVSGFNPDLGMVNAAVVFNSSNRTGEDSDLGTPNETFGGPGIGAGGEMGSPFQNDQRLLNVLIVAEDLVLDDSGKVADPDDADTVGASLAFDFTSLGSVTLHSLDLLDVEESEFNAVVCMTLLDGSIVGPIVLPQVGDNGYVKFPFGSVSGVVELIVKLNGSGAIDNLVFERDTCNPCIDVEVMCTDAGPDGMINIQGTVRNCGDVTLLEVIVVDDQAGLLLSLPKLEPGQEVAFTGGYIPTGSPSSNLTRTRAYTGPNCTPNVVRDSDTATCNVPMQGFCTQTQGGWGTTPKGKNPGSVLHANFAAVFPNGLVIGDPDGPDGDGAYALKLNSAQAVTNFLPAGGTPAGLDIDYSDATDTSAGVLAGQLVAATISIAMDEAGIPTSSGGTSSGGDLDDLILSSCATPGLVGKSVSDIVALANTAISGGDTGYSFSQLNAALTSINESFVDCMNQGSGCLSNP